jgi:hypothetical protein
VPVASDSARACSPALQRRARVATGIVLGVPLALLAALAWLVIAALGQ